MTASEVAQLRVRVIPNARKNELAGLRESEWILRLNAPAVEGKANRAAIDFVSRFFDVPRSAIFLISGERSRHKIFQIVGLKSSDLERKLAEIDRS